MLWLAHTAIIRNVHCKGHIIVLGCCGLKGTQVIIHKRSPASRSRATTLAENCGARHPGRRSRGTANEPGMKRAWSSSSPNAVSCGTRKAMDKGYRATGGPTLPFGLGLRGYFGRKLAYMGLRLSTILWGWTFEFQRCAECLLTCKDFQTLKKHKPMQYYVLSKVR